jgi:hypothetical protein
LFAVKRGNVVCDNEIRNATITDTFLGIEDHGLFVWTVSMDYGGAEQGFQRILASKAEASSVRVIRALLEAVGVDSWEQLPGKNVRCAIEGGLIRGVGHITKDTWYYAKDELTEPQTIAEAGK